MKTFINNYKDININIFYIAFTVIFTVIIVVFLRNIEKQMTRTRPREIPLTFENFDNNTTKTPFIQTQLIQKEIPRIITKGVPDNMLNVCASISSDGPYRINNTNVICSRDLKGSLTVGNVYNRNVSDNVCPLVARLPPKDQPQVVFQGAGGAPVGSQLYYARADTSKLTTPYSDAIWSPHCCKGKTLFGLSTSGGCLCGNYIAN